MGKSFGKHQRVVLEDLELFNGEGFPTDKSTIPKSIKMISSPKLQSKIGDIF